MSVFARNATRLRRHLAAASCVRLACCGYLVMALPAAAAAAGLIWPQSCWRAYLATKQLPQPQLLAALGFAATTKAERIRSDS